jgi:ribosome-binding ATPase
MLKAGIIGLPNVGKSTLFNALIRAHKAEAANYPFCTIEPNLGGVSVPDERLQALAPIAKTSLLIPTAVEFVDIAGLVRGASKGEGLGNKFLSHIREVDILIQVVRCFEDGNVHHVTGALDPLRDIEIVNTELVLADLEAVHKKMEKIAKDVKHGDKAALIEMELLNKLEPHLDAGKPANNLPLSKEEKQMARGFFLLTTKPALFAANVKDTDLANADQLPLVLRVQEYARQHLDCDTVTICAQLESDLIDLTPDEAVEFLHELGVKESGIKVLIQRVYQRLNLRTFFTFNEKEVRAWTVPAGATAAQAAGRIHSDFERGFIKAEVVKCQALVKCGSVTRARDLGHFRIEGRDYVVEDGDVIHFRFSV